MPTSCWPFRSLAVVAACVCAVPASAQIRASERGTVSQTVDGTVITVDYGRVQARGRDSLFGKVVHRNEMWTPGANAATTLTVSRDVTIAGRPLPAGKYSMWLVANPDTQWVLHLHTNAAFWHTAHPKAADMFLSVPVPHTMNGEHVEILTFDFPRVSPMRAELRLRWGPATVPIELGITPSMPRIALTDEQAAPYVGKYALTFQTPSGGRSPAVTLEIRNVNGALRGTMQMGGQAMEAEYLPTKEQHVFMPAFLKDGKIHDVEVTPMLFDVVDGRATGFRVIFQEKNWMEAKRIP